MSLPDMPTARVGHCSVVYQDKVWIIGGKNHINRPIKKVDCFDLKNGTWEADVSELRHARLYATAAVYENKIFVIGGYNNHQILSSVEYYDSSGGEWKEFIPLLQPREGADAVVFDGKLCVIGGMNIRGTIPMLLDTVEYLDGTTQPWQKSTTWILQKPRVFMQSVALEDYVYTSGGLLFDFELNSVERFGKYTGAEFRRSLPTPKFYFSAVRVGNYMYVLGGIGQDIIEARDDSIYYYKPGNDEWQALPITLSQPRAGLSTVCYEENIYMFGGIDSNLRILNQAAMLTGIPTGIPTSVVPKSQFVTQPTEHSLVHNYPNPFNSVTVITVQVAKQEHQLQLVIFNIIGEPVRSFHLNSPSPGVYQIQWDGRDEHGRIVESGIYVAKLRSDKMHRTILKLSFIK